MKKVVLMGVVSIVTVIVVLSFKSEATNKATVSNQPQKAIKLGAYYYDGWSSDFPGNVTKALQDTFTDRKPIWGWYTSSPDAMKGQIDAAADGGLSFFNFCWYFPNSNKTTMATSPLNRAVKLFLAAPNNSRLNFCLMVANHSGFIIGPKDWPAVSQAWLSLFKSPLYLKVNGSPYLSFFSMPSLIKSFGSADAVRSAFDSLRALSVKSGLKGVTIAACLPDANRSDVMMAKECGFDVITGYNSHGYGVKHDQMEAPIDSLVSGNKRLWNKFASFSALPYIPAVTLNWDPRGWATANNMYTKSPHYKGYSGNSVYKNVKAVKAWLRANPSQTTTDPIAVLYAWNEYGEGAWLTPSDKMKGDLLKGLKKASIEK